MQQASFRLVIPTRDSSRWISIFFDAYRVLGIKPLYLVDSRSMDGTIEVLNAKGAEVISVTPSADRVEAALSILPEIVADEWVLRLDDDEFPSGNLTAWLRSSLRTVEQPSVAVSRRDALVKDGKLLYSRFEDYYWLKSDLTYLNPQWRVFKP